MRFLAPLLAFPLLLAGCSQGPPDARGPAAEPNASATAAKSPASDAAPAEGSAPADARTSSADRPSADADVPPQVDELLRRVADFYRRQDRIHVEFQLEMQAELDGMTHAMDTSATISVERPNRLAIRYENSQFGADVVSDGQLVSLSLPLLQRYSQSPAPESLDELLNNPILAMSGGGRGPIVLDLFSSDPYQRLMDGVTGARYVGRKTLGEQDVDHLAFEQEQFDWGLWIAATGDPVVVQSEIDLAKSLRANLGNEKQQNAKLIVSQHYRNWEFGGELPGDAFAFVPPNGAEKVDDLLDALGGGEEPPSPLVGLPAPAVDLELLDGGRFRLDQHIGKHIVLLDFWATWCGPCIEEMPIVARIAQDYKDRDVVLFCMNQQEDAETVRTFLQETRLKVAVPLDRRGEAGEAFGVEGIPMLVLIDKAGVVQSVHVGFHPNIAQTIKKELDALLAGKDLAAEAEARRSAAVQVPEALHEAWTKPGRYASVATAADGKTLLASARGAIDRFDAAGQEIDSVKLSAKTRSGGLVRSARLTGEDPGELLVFGVWSAPLVAFDRSGTKLWQQPAGIDDVWAADLDRDGKDEVIVGHNGGKGLHVFDAAGQLLWKDTSIANVWHVTAGDLDGDGTLEVVTTSAVGKVHVFDAQGKSLSTLDAETYANMVRVFRLPGDTADSVLVVGGGFGEHQIVAMNGQGERLWQTELPATAEQCTALAAAPGSTWAAAAFRGGFVCVVDLRTGEHIVDAPQQGESVAWSLLNDKPLLVVAGTRGLTAWHIEPDSEPAP